MTIRTFSLLAAAGLTVSLAASVSISPATAQADTPMVSMSPEQHFHTMGASLLSVHNTSTTLNKDQALTKQLNNEALIVLKRHMATYNALVARICAKPTPPLSVEMTPMDVQRITAQFTRGCRTLVPANA